MLPFDFHPDLQAMASPHFDNYSFTLHRIDRIVLGKIETGAWCLLITDPVRILVITMVMRTMIIMRFMPLVTSGE